MDNLHLSPNFYGPAIPHPCLAIKFHNQIYQATPQHETIHIVPQVFPPFTVQSFRYQYKLHYSKAGFKASSHLTF